MKNKPNPLQDIEYKISISRLAEEKQRMLREILHAVRIKDIRQQGLELLFNDQQESNNINPYTIKCMLMEFLVLMTKDDVRKHLSQNHDYAEISRELITFFDHFDNNDFDVLRTVESLADYGENTEGHPLSWNVVNTEYERIVKNGGRYV